MSDMLCGDCGDCGGTIGTTCTYSIFPGAPKTEQDWDKIKKGVYVKIGEHYPKMIYGHIMAILQYVEEEMKKAQN